MFSRIGGGIGLAGGWKHLRGEGEGCGLHMGSGTLDFWTNVRENRANATCARVGAEHSGMLIRTASPQWWDVETRP